jgi:flagellar secretion chaperone FliS
MPVTNPWKSYHQTATLTAPPGQVILMLFDGALRFLERALIGFRCDDPAESNMAVNNNLQRARDIIRELDCALDHERGGDLAMTLHRLYDYFDGRILTSNLKKQSEGVEEVISHLSILRDAWATMLRGEGAAAIAGSAPLAGLVPAQAAF